MNTSTETTNILKAMIEAAPEISSISKSKQAYGYKYATLDSLIDMLRGVLPKHGLWFMQMPTRTGERSTLTTRVFHSSGEWLEDSIEMTDTELQGKANDTQKVGASITYFRRYALSSIFGVASDEDVDGNLNSKQPQNTRQSNTPQHNVISGQPKQKIDPKQYLKDDYSKRIDSGEPSESVLKDYADLLKTDSIRPLEELSDDDCKIVAVAIYMRNKK